MWRHAKNSSPNLVSDFVEQVLRRVVGEELLPDEHALGAVADETQRRLIVVDQVGHALWRHTQYTSAIVLGEHQVC